MPALYERFLAFQLAYREQNYKQYKKVHLPVFADPKHRVEELGIEVLRVAMIEPLVVDSDVFYIFFSGDDHFEAQLVS